MPPPKVHVYSKLVVEVRKALGLKTFYKWIKPKGFPTDVSIYNHLCKSPVPLVLQNRSVVTWYTCGPTVYDPSHIGHMCCYTRLDIIRRILERHFNLNVVQVMCVTDIDDKIIAKSKERGLDWRSLTATFEEEFFQSLALFRVTAPDVVVRVTQVIPNIISFVQALIDKGYAYVASDNSVYFDTEKYGRGNKLMNSENESSEAYRKNNPYKRNVNDFALWKAGTVGEPSWPSPWSNGRPGWHIECSTIAGLYFGSAIDIHSGGIDLLFPHHENEESQSCAYHKVLQWVNYWLHVGHLHVGEDVQKMSKSLGNVISSREFLNSKSVNEFRMLCLMNYYRSNLEYSDKIMERMAEYCDKFINFFECANAYKDGTLKTGNINSFLLLKKLDECKIAVCKCLANDFDTKSSIVELLDLMNVVYSMMDEKMGNRDVSAVVAVKNFIARTLNDFGVVFGQKGENDDDFSNDRMVKCVDSALLFRDKVREISINSIRNENVPLDAKKLLKFCDEFRKDLTSQGISVKDRGTSSTWSFSNKSTNESR